MTTGEFDFDDIFRQAPNGDSDSEPEIAFPEVSSTLWIVFIIVMPILLTNMLVSVSYYNTKLLVDYGKNG